MKRFRLALTLTFALSAPAWADFNDGIYALNAGQYEKALQTFIPLAEAQNHPYAQHALGIMYYQGRGVEQNSVEAAKWFQRAAEQGVAASQVKLGELYSTGNGVTQDYEYAYAWYSVAEKLGHPKATAGIQSAAGNLNPEELNEAKRLANQFVTKYGKEPEAVQKSE